MRGIVLASMDGRRFVCVPSGTAADFDTERDGGWWRACLSLRDSAGGMGHVYFDGLYGATFAELRKSVKLAAASHLKAWREFVAFTGGES